MSDPETAERMPLGLVFEWFQHEADAPYVDNWVVPVELGTIRTVAAALRRLDSLESSVEEMAVSNADGTVEEQRVFHVELCKGCDHLRLFDKPTPPDGG